MAKGLHYIATLDDSDFKKKFADQRRMILDSGKTAQAQGQMVENSFKKVAQSLAMIGGGMSVGYLAKELYTFAGAFDKSMKEVSTISKTVDADMNGFKSSVLEMTTQVPVGADAAAKALYQIVSAGHDGANGLQVLEVAAKAAIGGVTETVTAADAITTVLNAYKKNAGEAENISDQLFTTVRLGKTTFGELGQTISQVVPIAASFGIETEQVLAAVATLTKSGTPTAQAMTQIRASIVAASKVLGDGYFQTHTFQEGLNEIAQRAGGSESKLRALIPEIEGMNGVLGLTGINAKTAAADLAELGISAGATEQAFAKMKDEAGAQLTILKNTILKKFHDIGKGSVDMVGSFAKLLNSDGLFNDKVIDDVIASLVVLVATVGMYKASLIATNAIQRVSTSVQYAAEMAELTKLLPAKQADANADIMAAVAKGRLSQATAERLIAMRAEVAAELEALRVKAQLAHADMLAAMETDKAAKARLVSATALVAEKQNELMWAQQTGNAKVIETAQQALNNAETEKRSALAITRVTSGQLEVAQNKASSASLAVDTMQQNINTAATKGGTVAKNLFSAATLRLKSAFNSLKVAFATNPIGMILTGVTMAISLFSMFGSKMEDATDSVADLAKAERDLESATLQETAALNIMFNRLKRAKEGTDEYKDAKKSIQDKYGSLLSSMDQEARTLNDITLAQKLLTTAVLETSRARAMDQFIQNASGTAGDKQANAIKSIREKVYQERGGVAGKAILDEIKRVLQKYNTGEADGGTWSELQKTLFDAGIKTSYKSAKNPLADYILEQAKAYTGAARELRDATKEAEDIFGAPIETGSKNTPEDLKKRNTPQTAEETAAAQKAAEDYAKLQKEISDAQLAATKSLYDAETELKRKQITDKIKLMEFDRDETLKRLDEMIAAAKSEKEATTYRQQKEVVTQSVSVDIKTEQVDQLKAEQDRFKNLLDQYQTYTQQREGIEKKFNDDIAEMEKRRTSDNNTQIDEAIKIAQDRKKEALKSVNDEEAATMQKSSGLLVSLFEDASNKSVSEILKITATIDKLMSYLSTTETKDITPQFGFTADQLKLLKESPKELEAIRDGVEKLNSEAVQKNPFETLIKNLKDVFSTGKNDDATEKKLAKLGESASASANIIGNLAGELSTMFEAMGNDKLAGAMSTVQGVVSAVSNIGEGFAKGGLIGGIGAAIGEITKGITALFKAGDRRKENEIKQLQEQVDVLQKSYDVLGDSIEKAYSTDAKGLIEDQNKMLEQQNALIKNQIAEEEAKKDTDWERIDEWNARIEENNKLIDENKEKAIDAIFGEDLKSAIDNFATAYANAWASGEERAQSAKDTVRQMMRQMVTESIKAAIQSSEAMEKIRNKLEEFYADNILTGWEQDYIYGMAESLQKELDRQFGWADSLMKDEDDPTREASERGIATASQESVDENNGRLTAIQGHTSAISGNVTLMQLDIMSVRDSMSTLRDTAVAQLTVMRGIESNTQSLNRLEKIETDMGSVKNTLNDIAIKGIIIR